MNAKLAALILSMAVGCAFFAGYATNVTGGITTSSESRMSVMEVCDSFHAGVAGGELSGATAEALKIAQLFCKKVKAETKWEDPADGLLSCKNAGYSSESAANTYSTLISGLFTSMDGATNEDYINTAVENYYCNHCGGSGCTTENNHPRVKREVGAPLCIESCVSSCEDEFDCDCIAACDTSSCSEEIAGNVAGYVESCRGNGRRLKSMLKNQKIPSTRKLWSHGHNPHGHSPHSHTPFEYGDPDDWTYNSWTFYETSNHAGSWAPGTRRGSSFWATQKTNWLNSNNPTGCLPSWAHSQRGNALKGVGQWGDAYRNDRGRWGCTNGHSTQTYHNAGSEPKAWWEYNPTTMNVGGRNIVIYEPCNAVAGIDFDYMLCHRNNMKSDAHSVRAASLLSFGNLFYHGGSCLGAPNYADVIPISMLFARQFQISHPNHQTGAIGGYDYSETNSDIEWLFNKINGPYTQWEGALEKMKAKFPDYMSSIALIATRAAHTCSGYCGWGSSVDSIFKNIRDLISPDNYNSQHNGYPAYNYRVCNQVFMIAAQFLDALRQQEAVLPDIFQEVAFKHNNPHRRDAQCGVNANQYGNQQNRDVQAHSQWHWKARDVISNFWSLAQNTRNAGRC